METRSSTLTVPFELKAVPDEKGAFEGYGSVFGNLDSDADIVVRGAFQESLAEHARRGTMPKLLWQHRPDLPIGVWETIGEDQQGLRVKGRLLLDVQRGREAHALLKAGAIDGLSIGFQTLESETDEQRSVRKLTKLNLLEVSLVTFPANRNAVVSGVKSIQTVREFEAVMRRLGFSKRQARIIATRGWQGLQSEPADGGGLDTLVAAIDRAERTLIETTQILACH